MEQRLIGLTFQKSPGHSLKATTPPDSSTAPPGYYMLFLLNQNGVPSVAQFVHLSATPQNRPPRGTIASPLRDVVIHPGDSVDFAGRATDQDGSVTGYAWIFPGGTPSGSTMQSPGEVTFQEPGTYVVSMTVTDDLGVSDPSPPTRRVVVKP
jgi:chitodextrinase